MESEPSIWYIVLSQFDSRSLPLAHAHRNLPYIQSQKCPKEDFNVKDLNLKLQGESFWVRGHLQVVRAKSKTPFFTLRERMATIQAILHESDKGSEDDLSTDSEMWWSPRQGEVGHRLLHSRQVPAGCASILHDAGPEGLALEQLMMIRGEEIVSGAQRVHHPKLLMQAWASSVYWSGACGMPYLSLGKIRMTSMFPRDPERLFP
ncbi:aspartyl-tRNA synthetase, cytoplasmic [Phytophthora nicotianae]|uniref:Aspartyl-tRNA synthetase, cytoplasmic n=2 Tax=Phytophthora nicotianae TaxID=4792 RepID=W2MBV3_PHYNI|nr:aspartyl-tRNA synthetase, cytoplasmic [Phytophthora nicotianae]